MSPTTSFWIGVGVGVAGYLAWATYRVSKVAPEVIRRFEEDVKRSFEQGKDIGRSQARLENEGFQFGKDGSVFF